MERIIVAIIFVTVVVLCNRKLDQFYAKRAEAETDCEKKCLPHPSRVELGRCLCVVSEEFR